LTEFHLPFDETIVDQRTAEIFEQPVTVSKAYMPKLVRQVNKIHACSSGPYALVM
jgi:DNA-directed RNA polymerase beta subunit